MPEASNNVKVQDGAEKNLTGAEYLFEGSTEAGRAFKNTKKDFNKRAKSSEDEKRGGTEIDESTGERKLKSKASAGALGRTQTFTQKQRLRHVADPIDYRKLTFLFSKNTFCTA